MQQQQQPMQPPPPQQQAPFFSGMQPQWNGFQEGPPQHHMNYMPHQLMYQPQFRKAEVGVGGGGGG